MGNTKSANSMCLDDLHEWWEEYAEEIPSGSGVYLVPQSKAKLFCQSVQKDKDCEDLLSYEFSSAHDPMGLNKIEFAKFLETLHYYYFPNTQLSLSNDLSEVINQNFNSYKRPVEVFLSLYNLNVNLTGFNNAALSFLNLDAWHTAIFVYGTELSYCEGDGIHQTEARASHIGAHQDMVWLGHTYVSPEDLTVLLQQLGETWRGDNYNMLEHNCMHFCDKLCIHLVQRHLPSNITKILDYISKVPVSAKGSTGSGSTGAESATSGELQATGSSSLSASKSFDISLVGVDTPAPATLAPTTSSTSTTTTTSTAPTSQKERGLKSLFTRTTSSREHQPHNTKTSNREHESHNTKSRSRDRDQSHRKARSRERSPRATAKSASREREMYNTAQELTKSDPSNKSARQRLPKPKSELQPKKARRIVIEDYEETRLCVAESQRVWLEKMAVFCPETEEEPTTSFFI